MNISPTLIIKHPDTILIGQNILCYRSVPTTMDIARKVEKEEIGEGTAIVSTEQTSGRGRFKRRWLSPPGRSLSISIILRPDVSLLPQLNMIASLAVVQCIEKVASLQSSIKWPNDVLINGKKLSGILIENVFEGNKLEAAIIGIGINVELDPASFPEISQIATSLFVESNKRISRRDVLFSLLREFDSLYQELNRGEPIYERWLSHVETIGKQVQIQSGDIIEEGYVETINMDGSLTLKRNNGSLITLVAGEVTLHK